VGFQEWAPNATSIFLTGTFTGWTEKDNYKLKKIILMATGKLSCQKRL